MSLRYLEVCGNALDDESAQKKLGSTALSCVLNTAACKLKLQQWHEAIESCDEVRRSREFRTLFRLGYLSPCWLLECHITIKFKGESCSGELSH